MRGELSPKEGGVNAETVTDQGTCAPLPHGKPALILASASPRRIELLKRLVKHFRVVPGNIDERTMKGEDPSAYALRISRMKAEEVCSVTAKDGATNWILAADTSVVLDRAIYGKPEGPPRARWMLKSLRGRGHEVISGICLMHREKGIVCLEAIRSQVWMREIRDEEIEAYIETGEPFDKAGAYAIQGMGARFVTRVEGSYTNVVGLPLERVQEIFGGYGIT